MLYWTKQHLAENPDWMEIEARDRKVKVYFQGFRVLILARKLGLQGREREHSI